MDATAWAAEVGTAAGVMGFVLTDEEVNASCASKHSVPTTNGSATNGSAANDYYYDPRSGDDGLAPAVKAERERLPSGGGMIH